MKENTTRAGQVVAVRNIGRCVLWAQAPSGAWWAIPDRGDTVRIRYKNGIWVEAKKEHREKDPKPKPDETGTMPLF